MNFKIGDNVCTKNKALKGIVIEIQKERYSGDVIVVRLVGHRFNSFFYEKDLILEHKGHKLTKIFK